MVSTRRQVATAPANTRNAQTYRINGVTRRLFDNLPIVTVGQRVIIRRGQGKGTFATIINVFPNGDARV